MHIFIFVILLLFVTNPAQSEYVKKTDIGNWSGGAFIGTKSRVFSFCDYEMEFSDKTLFSILFNSSFQPFLFLTDKSFSWKPDETLSATVTVEGTEKTIYTLPAKGASETVLRIDLPPFPDTYSVLKHATHVTVQAGSTNARFKVDGIDKVIPATIQCVVRERAKMQEPPALYRPEGVTKEQAEIAYTGMALAAAMATGKEIISRDAYLKSKPGVIVTWMDTALPLYSAEATLGPALIGATAQQADANLWASFLQRAHSSGIKTEKLPNYPGRTNMFGYAMQQDERFWQLRYFQLPFSKNWIGIKISLLKGAKQTDFPTIDERLQKAVSDVFGD